MKKCFALLSTLAMASAVMAAKPLSIWIMPNGASPQEKLEEELKVFTRQTGIQVNVTVLDWGEAWGRISMALEKSNNPPSVVQLGTTWLPYFASRQTLLDLDPYMKAIKPERFMPVSFGTTHIQSDPKIYSVPWFVDARTLLGNKKVLDKLNITDQDIETYEGFTEALRKINAAKLTKEDGTPIKAYAFPGKNDWNIPHNFAPWVWSEGGTFVHTENGITRSSLFDASTLKGIAKYLKFVKDSIVDREFLSQNTAQIVQKFNNGELAFILNTAEIAMQLRFPSSEGGLQSAQIAADGLQMFPIPRGAAGSVGFIGGSNLAIPAKAADRENALKLLMFLTADSTLDAYTRHIGFLPPTETALASWSADSTYTPLINGLKRGHAYPSLPKWGEIESILSSLFSDIWSLLEIEGLYSDEKIYEILSRNDVILNQLLGDSTAVPSITVEDFKKIWDPIYFSKVNFSKENAHQTNVSSNQKEESIPISYTIGLLLLAVIAGFIFTYRRKK